MIYKIVITPVAKQNIEEATAYYKNKVSTKVAKSFIDDYKKRFKTFRKPCISGAFFITSVANP